VVIEVVILMRLAMTGDGTYVVDYNTECISEYHSTNWWLPVSPWSLGPRVHCSTLVKYPALASLHSKSAGHVKSSFGKSHIMTSLLLFQHSQSFYLPYLLAQNPQAKPM